MTDEVASTSEQAKEAVVGRVSLVNRIRKNTAEEVKAMKRKIHILALEYYPNPLDRDVRVPVVCNDTMSEGSAS